MATVTPILRTAKARPDGHAPIWLRFSDLRRTVYASLGVYVHPRFWNDRKREVRKGHPHADRINGLIARRLADSEDERLRLRTDRKPVTAEALLDEDGATADALGYTLAVRTRRSYEYSPAVDRLSDELKALKTYEEKSGVAACVRASGYVTVTRAGPGRGP